MLKHIKSFYKQVKAHDASLHSFLEILLFPGMYALLLYRLSHLFYVIKLHFIARLIMVISRLLTGIEIHPGAKIGYGLFIDHGSGVVIGETTIIKNNVLIYQGVTLGAKGTEKNKVKRHPTINDNVIIGAGAKILGDIVIEENVIIGANSVVTKNIKANTTVAGIPAREIIKKKMI